MGRYADTSAYSDGELKLWEKLREGEGRVYHTAKGLEFTYRIAGNELFVSRREKSITRATVNAAFRRAVELMAAEGCVQGPKKLGTFGASYLYPVFLDMGIIRE